MEIAPQFVAKVHRVFGDRGRAWLPELPRLAAACRRQWGLAEGEPCPVVSMNYIEFTTTREGEPAALKVGVPHPELFTEMEALGLYGGRGAVELLACDRDLGALLLRRALPGTMLWELGDDAEETRIAAEVTARLPVPVPAGCGLPRFGDWVADAFRATRTELDPQERMPRELIDAAEAAFAELVAAVPGEVVLHGDLHHENILLDERRGWVAIDPKGAIGPPCLEVGRFLQNQLPGHLSLEARVEAMRQRVAILGDRLGYDGRTVAAAGLVDCVLSHCWSLEDEELSPDWHLGVELARALAEMR
ncbi:MAG: aminoglycoside phosphotransferase family protein [Gemmatimonadota bacterium]